MLEPRLPRRAGSWGGIAKDNRQFIDAVFRIMRISAPWRDLPPDYSNWSNTRTVVWIDASHSKVHASGARGGNQEMSRTKKGLNTKLHLAVDTLPSRAPVTTKVQEQTVKRQTA